MRADMAKVIVERPRLGSYQKTQKGYRKRWQKLAPEDWPRRERISDHKGETKFFNEHLGPLRRYLLKQAGRPWNKVFAEICERMKLDSVVQNHLRGHVFDYVVLDVIEIDGVLCHGSGRLRNWPLARFAWSLLYVCPRTGILRRIEKHKDKPVLKRIGDNATTQYHLVAGRWYEVQLRKLPIDCDGCWEALLDKPLHKCNDNELTAAYGMLAYALSKRQLSERESRKLLKASTKRR